MSKNEYLNLFHSIFIERFQNSRRINHPQIGDKVIVSFRQREAKFEKNVSHSLKQ
jgi:hypothetical protein